MATKKRHNPFLRVLPIPNRKPASQILTATEAAPKETWAEFARKTLIRSGRKLVPFDPYHYQERMVELIQAHYGTVAIKTRQMGFTELVASYFLWEAKDNPAYLAVVFSKTQSDTANIARRVRTMSASHPDIELETENLKDLKLKNGGRIVFKASTTHGARGLESVSAILFDECAFVPDIEEIYGSALPSTEMLGEDARIILLSTPNGAKGFYYQRAAESNGDRDLLTVCRQVREGEVDPVQWWVDDGGWVKFVVHWRAHPIYSQRPDYLETIKKRQKLTEAQLQREYNLSFDEASNALFQPALVHAAATGEWLPVRQQRQYLCGIDPSFGGEDYFVCQVWDCTEPPYSKVAQFRENRRSKDYYRDQCIRLFDEYKPVAIAVEQNAGGSLYIDEFIALRPNFKIVPVLTTQRSKLVNTDRLVLLLERGHLRFPPDDPMIEEMVNYQETVNETTGNRKREAAFGYNDDTVMAPAVAFTQLEALTKQIDARELLTVLS